MNIKLNPDALGNMFAVPGDVADKHLKLASEVQLKVLLVLLREGVGNFSPEQCAARLNISLETVNESLIYWQQRGILLGAVAEQTDAPKAAVVKQTLPSRRQVAVRIGESRELAELLRIAEQKFGRMLRQNEMATLVHLCDDEGMAPPVLLMLIEQAVGEGRCTISHIERTAVQWINKGVQTVADAERELKAADANRKAWAIVCRAFGMEQRRPSEKEQQAADRWINEWRFSTDMLRLAYDRCVDNKGKMLVSYIDKVLGSWHAQGITQPSELEQHDNKKTKKDTKNTSFDLSLFNEGM